MLSSLRLLDTEMVIHVLGPLLLHTSCVKRSTVKI